MTNISKQPMSAAELEQLFSQLNKVIAILDQDSANDFLRDLLGKEERVMLAKRFAIIVMLTENYSCYQVAAKLKVSTSTVGSIQERLEAGSYDRLLSQLSQDKATYLNLWETLDSILHLGGVLPHYVGLDRYRGIR